MLVLTGCGKDRQPLPDMSATVEANVKERIADIPTPTAMIVVKEVVKEVVVSSKPIARSTRLDTKKPPGWY